MKKFIFLMITCHLYVILIFSFCIIKFSEHVKYLLIILRNVLNIYILMFVKLVYEIINYDNMFSFY